MAPMHYAPKTQFIIVENIQTFINQNEQLNIGVLTMGDKCITNTNLVVINLSSIMDLEEASTNLYQSMYELDGLGLDCIIIEKFPSIGIGHSLNDRITRASYAPVVDSM
jgi:L-threonylcarbamoyladenylate synthase